MTSAGLNSEGREGIPEWQNDAFVVLVPQSRGLSAHGAVWYSAPDTGAPGYVYFDNGESDYPVADGLIYSTSPTTPPPFRSKSDDISHAVLSTPTPVAPHWWIAAWDPFLFSNGVSYDGRDYSAIGTSMRIDPHSLKGPSGTVQGRFLTGVTYEDESDVDVDIIETGHDKPVCVVVNRHTVNHKSVDAGFQTYRVRYSTLTGGRRIAFALDKWE